MKFKILQPFTSVEDYLSQFLKVSKKNIHTIRMQSHHDKQTIKINGKEADLTSSISTNDLLEVNIVLSTSKYLSNTTATINKEYEDDYILVVSKPFGIKTHPNEIEVENDTLVNYLIADYNYLEPIHRLDIDTCGLVILAKTPLIKAKLDQMLEQRTIKRYYTALIKNNIKPQTINTNIGRDSKEKNKMAVTRNGKNAITNILECSKLDQNRFAVLISLETGRTHQIRAHMDFIHHPILNDPMYHPNGKNATEFGQYLHAETLGFVHPITQEKLYFESPLPKEFEEMIQELQ